MMLTSTFIEIIGLLGDINNIHKVHYSLDLGMVCNFTVIYFHENSYIPTTSGEIFLSVFLEHVKYSLQFLLSHPERMEYIVQHVDDKNVFNEIVGNLAGLHFKNAHAFELK